MKSLLMGLGVVYFAGFLVSATYLASQSGWDDVPRVLGLDLVGGKKLLAT